MIPKVYANIGVNRWLAMGATLEYEHIDSIYRGSSITESNGQNIVRCDMEFLLYFSISLNDSSSSKQSTRIPFIHRSQPHTTNYRF